MIRRRDFITLLGGAAAETSGVRQLGSKRTPLFGGRAYASPHSSRCATHLQRTGPSGCVETYFTS
jgi:hypothetical protein